MSLLVLRSVKLTEFSSIPLFESGEKVLETLSFLKRFLLMPLGTFFVISELFSFNRRNSWSRISATLCLFRGFCSKNIESVRLGKISQSVKSIANSELSIQACRLQQQV